MRCIKPSPTHATIAAACGVSVSTVSRALGGNPVIPEKTRQKINAKAIEMGWKVNPLVSAYMTHLRTTREARFRANLAYIIPFPNVQKLEQLPGYHLEHFHGCREQAHSLGYSLEPIWYAEWEGSGKRLSRLLRSRGIPGIIVHGIAVTRPDYDDFDWSSFAVCSWGAPSPDYPLHLSSAHHYYDMSLAISKIREYGYRKIALMLFESQDDLSEHAFYASFLYTKTFERAGLSLNHFRLSETISTETKRNLTREWLLKHDIDLVIGEQLVWELLKEMKVPVPEQTGFVSMCWSSGWPQIGGVDQMAGVIGRNTIDLVVSQLVRNERGLPTNVKFLYNCGIWVDGPSCPQRNRRPEVDRVLSHV